MDGTWTKMDEYRKRGLFVDVKFIVGDKDFKAHKVVLSSQSSVLEAMFTSGMEEAQSGTVNIVDIKPEVFEVFLAFIYTRKVHETTLSTYVDELLYCAVKYAVSELTELCCRYFETHYSLLRRLILADMYHLSHMKTKASQEIAVFGWERLKSEEWYEMFTDFRLTTEVLHFVMPSCIAKKWAIMPDMWLPSPILPRFFIHIPAFHLRSNGRPCKISVRLICFRRNIKGTILYHPQSNGPKVVELSFEFSIGAKAHFCGKGDVWWDRSDIGNEVQEISEDIFDHTFSVDRAIKDIPLEFTLTLRPWAPPKTDFLLLSSPVGAGRTGTAVLKVRNATFTVNKEFLRTESEFFHHLMRDDEKVYEIKNVDVETFRKLHPYMLTGENPCSVGVEVDFHMVLCVRYLGLSNLCRYLEQILDRRLHDSSPVVGLSRAIDLLISATDDHCQFLIHSALSYIDRNVKEVIDSPAWVRLKDRPDLVYLIVQRMLEYNDPDLSDGPDSDGSTWGSESEVEAIMDCLD